MLGCNLRGNLRAYGNDYAVNGDAIEIYGMMGEISNSKLSYLGGKYTQIRNSSIVAYANLLDITAIYGFA